MPSLQMPGIRSVRIDPVMAGILDAAKAGDILRNLPSGKVKTPNYTMPARGAAVLDEIPHWLCQFRGTVFDVPDDEGIIRRRHLAIGNLYAEPRGHRSVSYRHRAGGRLEFSIQGESHSEAVGHSLVGKDLRDIVDWGAIPRGMTVSGVRITRAEHGAWTAGRVPRWARQPGVADQIHLTVDGFDWLEYEPGEAQDRWAPSWRERPFADADGNVYENLTRFVTKSHDDPVDARLCRDLSGFQSAIAHLSLDNALDPGGWTYSPHLCLQQSHHRMRGMTELRTLKGAWVRRRRIMGRGPCIEWMVPLHVNTRAALDAALARYHVLVLDEDGAISAYRSDRAVPHGMRQTILDHRAHSLARRGIDPMDGNAPPLVYRT